MKRAPREQRVYLLSIFFAAAPFAFALLRAITGGDDLRFLWMAFASFLGATAVRAVGRDRSRETRVLLALSGMVLVIATLLAGLAARLLGATAAPGIWAVAFVFGLCWAVSYMLDSLSSRAPE